MLKELSKYDNLGTPGYHFQLLKILRDIANAKWLCNNGLGFRACREPLKIWPH
jgi:hypothetical protein